MKTNTARGASQRQPEPDTAEAIERLLAAHHDLCAAINFVDGGVRCNESRTAVIAPKSLKAIRAAQKALTEFLTYAEWEAA